MAAVWGSQNLLMYNFWGSAAAGQADRSVSWSIHDVFRRISIDNHMFFHLWAVARRGLVFRGDLAVVRDIT